MPPRRANRGRANKSAVCPLAVSGAEGARAIAHLYASQHDGRVGSAGRERRPPGGHPRRHCERTRHARGGCVGGVVQGAGHGQERASLPLPWSRVGHSRGVNKVAQGSRSAGALSSPAPLLPSPSRGGVWGALAAHPQRRGAAHGRQRLVCRRRPRMGRGRVAPLQALRMRHVSAGGRERACVEGVSLSARRRC